MKAPKPQFLIGIDEAGRGPLAGPVAVGAVCVRRDVLARGTLDKLIKGSPRLPLRDSKQLSPTAREAWFAKIRAWQKSGQLTFAVALIGAKIIDREGIVSAVQLGIARCLRRLEIGQHRVLTKKARVLLDGALKAPRRYKNQQTIIRGDETEPLIALASIVAKVRRDRHLVRLAALYPHYDLAIHKGYGTAAHYRALRRHGPSPIHRRTFLN